MAKANPSFYYMPNLRRQLEEEYKDSLKNPHLRLEIKTKRFNLPSQDTYTPVTDWENVLATNREMPDLRGEECIGCLDYAEINDFWGMGLLFKKDDIYCFKQHSFISHPSIIKYPLDARVDLQLAAEQGPCTIVDEVISPEMVAYWFLEQS